MRTKMRAKAFPGEDPMSLPEPVALWPLVAGLVDPAGETHGEIVDFATQSEPA